MSENSLLEKVLGLQEKYASLQEQLSDPEVVSDMKKYVQLNKEYKELAPIIKAGNEYRKMLEDYDNAKDILANEKDEELREMAKEEIAAIEPEIPVMEQNIKLMLIPADPQDGKNAILEIRGGTGGDEAAIFAGDLLRMYSKYCERKGWKMEITNQSEGAAGGFKEVVCKVSGEGVYGVLKYESGVHRVQRVPQTETQGRVHTSAASVAVLPEADEFDIELNMTDIRTDTFCSSGPGGQSVNTTYSAIRLTHIPSGIVVQCQDEKSQLKNFDKALSELRTRLYNMEYEKYLNEISAKRKTMVSTGDRSAKIRTYNYPQSRVTDHRINYTMYNLPAFMDGDIQEVLDQLQIAENAERLKAAENMEKALRTIVERYGLTALTIKCFDLLDTCRTTACLALARLNDDGIVCGCEGDIPTLWTMMTVYAHCGKVPFMANPSSSDHKLLRVDFAHCTVPTSMTESFTLPTHFESGIGVGIAGILPTGRYSVVKIGGKKLDRLFWAKGTVTANTKIAERCRTQVSFRFDNEEDFDRFFASRLGNHIVMTPEI